MHSTWLQNVDNFTTVLFYSPAVFAKAQTILIFLLNLVCVFVYKFVVA